MNERIRQLAEQAGQRYYPSSNEGPLRVEYLTPELEKFAELIVRECMDRIQVLSKDAQGEWCGEWNESDVLKHFGVE